MARATVELDRTILHSLPRGKWSDGRDPEVIYSNDVADLQPKSLDFFAEQLQPAVEWGREVVADVGAPSPVPSAVEALLASSSELVARSAEVARHMFNVQAPQSPSAVFFMATGSIATVPSIIIMKVEHQKGLQITRTAGENGTSLVAQFLEDLIVGDKTDIYKIAILQAAGSRVHGRMLDRQNGVAFADYFLYDFLGCQLAVQDELLVKEFVDTAISFANLPSHDPEKRDRYARAVAAELASADPRLDPLGWAAKHLDATDRDQFEQMLPPHVARSAFAKDLKMVKQHLGGVRYVTDTGVWISFNPEVVPDDVIQFRTSELGQEEIVIRGSIASSQFRRAPRS